MKVNKVFCFFEQSGTFKKEFRKLGVSAEDYDIKNDFGETDNIVDLFSEIRNGYDGKPSIFDTVTQDDLILAFFPCIRFENQVMLQFRGQSYNQRNMTITEKMEHCMKIQNELTSMYELVNKMFIVCIRKGLRLIMENPFSEEHYLRRYWCYPPAIIDKDRRERGDYYCKPTQYWFLNCSPESNFVFEPLTWNGLDTKDAMRLMPKEKWEKTGAPNKTVARSMIHPDYANRFIREFIL